MPKVAHMDKETEQIFWKDSPSQWLNLGAYCLTLFIAAGIIALGIVFPPAYAALIIPAIYAFWRYLTVRCQTYELTSERLRITKGVINQKIDEIELYRVKDFIIIRKWWMRLLGLGTLHLKTSDRSTPNLDIPVVHNCIDLREKLRTRVEFMRDKKRVREMDFDETGDFEGFESLGE